MDVVVLTETKKKGTGSEILGNYIHHFSGVKKYGKCKNIHTLQGELHSQWIL